MAKFSVFKDQESLFACPICQAPMHLDCLAWFVRIGIPLISASRAL